MNELHQLIRIDKMSLKDAFEKVKKEIATLRIDRRVYDEILRVSENYARWSRDEWAGLLISDLEKVTRQVTFREGELYSTSSYFEASPEDFKKLLQRTNLKEDEYLAGMWHSHPSFTPEHSGTDLRAMKSIWIEEQNEMRLPIKAFYEKENLLIEFPIEYKKKDEITIQLQDLSRKNRTAKVTLDPEFCKNLEESKQPILNLGFKQKFFVWYFHSLVVKPSGGRYWHDDYCRTKFIYKTSSCSICGDYLEDLLEGKVKIV